MVARVSVWEWWNWTWKQECGIFRANCRFIMVEARRKAENTSEFDWLLLYKMKLTYISLESGHMLMKFQPQKTSSPTHQQFHIQMRSTKLSNHTLEFYADYSPHQIVPALKFQAQSYPPRSGWKTMGKTLKRLSFRMLEPCPSLREPKSQTGLKLTSVETKKFG